VLLTAPLLSALLACVSAQEPPDVSHSCYDREGHPISCGGQAPSYRNRRQEEREWREFLEEQKRRSEQEAREAAEKKARELEEQIEQARQLRRLDDERRLRDQLAKLKEYSDELAQQKKLDDQVQQNRIQEQLQKLDSDTRLRNQLAELDAQTARINRQKSQAGKQRVMSFAQAAQAVAASKREGRQSYTLALRTQGRVALVNERHERVELGNSAGWGLLLIHQGDRLSAQDGGQVQLLLPDGTTFTLSGTDWGEFELDDFLYDPDPNGTPRKIAVKLLIGAMRWTTGARCRFVDCPREEEEQKRLMIRNSAAVGIRGTDFQATVDRDENAVVKLFAGAIDVTDKVGGRSVDVAPGQIVFVRAGGGIDGPRAMLPSERQDSLPRPQ
jgi:hypothetical protein